MNSPAINALLPDGLPGPIDPDRGGYTVTMRENAGAERVLDALGADTMESERLIHVGWGSFRNLDISAVRRSSEVLLLDINLHQFRIWDAVRQAMDAVGADDAERFVDLLAERLPTKPRLRQFMPGTRDWLRADMEREGSWLCRKAPERFAWIRRLFCENRVTTGCLDIRADPANGIFAALARNIERATGEHGASFDTLYMSNLPWMMAQHEDFFGEGGHHRTREWAAHNLQQVRANLAVIAPLFRHIVAAAQLAETSRAGDLEWRTDLLDSAAFIDPAYWSGLSAMDGAFRSLT